MSIVVTAVNLAAIYSLVAIGLALTWAGLGFLNLAHGAIFTAAGYGAWWTSVHLSAAPPVVIAAGMVVGVLAGAFVGLAVFLPLDGRRNWEIRTLTATLALSFLAVNVFQETFGPSPKQLPTLFGGGRFHLGDTVVTADKTGAVVVAVVVLGLALAALLRSRLGLGIRVLTQDTVGAAIVGINRRALAFAILAVSGGLAGLASVLLAQVFYVSPNAGYVPLVIGLIVALLGGLGSVPGTIAAAILVAIVESLTATYLGGQYVLVTLFALIAVVLMVRPRGLGGLLEATRA